MTEFFRKDATTDNNFYAMLADYEARIQNLERIVSTTIPGITPAYNGMRFEGASEAFALTTSTWTPIDNWTLQTAANRYIQSDLTNGLFTPTLGGIYMASLYLTYEGNQNNRSVVFSEYIAGGIGGELGEFPMPRAEQQFAAMTPAPIRLDAGSSFGIAVQSVGGSVTITVSDGIFSIFRIDS